jgi:hypothetical protein
MPDKATEMAAVLDNYLKSVNAETPSANPAAKKKKKAKAK